MLEGSDIWEPSWFHSQARPTQFKCKQNMFPFRTVHDTTYVMHEIKTKVLMQKAVIRIFIAYYLP